MNDEQRSKLWKLTKILLAFGLLAAIASRVKFVDLINLLAHLPLPGLIASFAIYFLMNMAKALQYHILINGRVSYFRMLYIVLINNTISNFIASSAGIASYLAALKMESSINFTKDRKSVV